MGVFVKLFIYFIIFSMSSITFARDRVELEQRALKLIRKIDLKSSEIRLLNYHDLESLVYNLRSAKSIINGRQIAPRPPHHNRRRFLICELDDSSLMTQAFNKVYKFAYSTRGLNYSTNRARVFAQEWIKNFQCKRADSYIENFQKLYKFAYRSNGLFLSSQKARQYAREKVENFCSDYNIESEFKNYYTFAYQSNGLNMSSHHARAYAREKVESVGFSCNQRRLRPYR